MSPEAPSWTSKSEKRFYFLAFLFVALVVIFVLIVPPRRSGSTSEDPTKIENQESNTSAVAARPTYDSMDEHQIKNMIANEVMHCGDEIDPLAVMERVRSLTARLKDTLEATKVLLVLPTYLLLSDSLKRLDQELASLNSQDDEISGSLAAQQTTESELSESPSFLLTGYMVADLHQGGLYEIATIFDGIVSPKHAYLQTKQTVFQSQGMFSLSVRKLKHSSLATLKPEFGGFMQTWNVYEEVTDDEIKRETARAESRTKTVALLKKRRITVNAKKESINKLIKRLGPGIETSRERIRAILNNIILDLPDDFKAKLLQDTGTIAPGLVRISANQYCTLRGRLIRKLFYGPPNFGKDTLTDAKVYDVILQLFDPILFRDEYLQSAQWDTVRSVDVMDIHNQFKMSHFLNARVRVRCTLEATITGHYHTPALTGNLFSIEKTSTETDRRAAYGVDDSAVSQFLSNLVANPSTCYRLRTETGDLNGDNEADEVVRYVLADRYSPERILGSGYAVFINVKRGLKLLVDYKGKPNSNLLSIHAGRINIEEYAFAPTDEPCCPSKKWQTGLRLQGKHLVEVK